VIDEFYSMNLSQDIMRGLKENAARGFSNGGQLPFGYRKLNVQADALEKASWSPKRPRREWSNGFSVWLFRGLAGRTSRRP